MDDPTTITIEKQTWKKLNARKEPGESFDEVVTRLIEESDNGN